MSKTEGNWTYHVVLKLELTEESDLTMWNWHTLLDLQASESAEIVAIGEEYPDDVDGAILEDDDPSFDAFRQKGGEFGQ